MYPEHDKLAAVKNQSQEIGEFLEWLGNDSVFLCRWNESCSETVDDPDGKSVFNPSGTMTLYESAKYLPVNENTNNLLSQYFGIDLDILEQENWEMLEGLRSQNE